MARHVVFGAGPVGRQTAMELLAAPEVLAKGPLEHIPETVAEAQLAVDDKFLYSLFQSNLCLKMHGKGA